MTATQRGSLRVGEPMEQPPTSTQETPMLARLMCALGFHRVITRSDKPKTGAGGPVAIVRGFCYRPHCKFEFAKRLKLSASEVTD